MTKLIWDATGERIYETGVDRGVLYMPKPGNTYGDGVAWNGLTGVTESPSGGEPSVQYADNMKYITLMSAEEMGGTIEALTYPKEFYPFDGVVEINGVSLGQQDRGKFGLSYRTRVGNDVEGDSYSTKYHLIYGCSAKPSEKAYTTINDSPEALTFSWEFTSEPVILDENAGLGSYKPISSVTIDSRALGSVKTQELTDILWGTVSTDPRMPTIEELLTLATGGGLVQVDLEPPTVFENEITFPAVTGVEYLINGLPQTEPYVLGVDERVLVVARTKPGYKFPAGVDIDWQFDYEII